MAEVNSIDMDDGPECGVRNFRGFGGANIALMQ
jgi:hypothetical protein